ncbi:MAG: hypothetical protein M3M96_05930 [Candidatus Eremiobacteraeota bacterium]|nr:hypothetical protein [Candidatus Eremiobacteraeota bacterium]
MTQTGRDFENTFARTWELLRKNWIMIVPGAVLGVAHGAVSYLVGTALSGALAVYGHVGDLHFVSQAVYAVVMMAVGMLFTIAQMAFVTGMAGAAWKFGRTSLADGWKSLARRSSDVFLAFVLLALIGSCAAVLAPVTFLTTIVAYAVFLIYTPSSVIIGGRGAVSAIAESCRLAVSSVVPTIAVVASIAAIALLGGLTGALIGRSSAFVGGLAAGLIEQLIVAYASLVIAGEYLKLREAADRLAVHPAIDSKG